METKKLLLGTVLVALSLCISSAFAIDFMGPPTAELQKGQWSVGYNYVYSSQDLDKTKVKWSYFEDGELDDSGTEQLKVKDLKVQRHYATINYGLSDCWEIYARLGGADAKADVRLESLGLDGGINFDNDFAWGWGTKVTFHKQDNIKWGASLQMNWLDTSWSEKGSYSEDGYVESWKDEVDVESYDVLLAVGPTVDMGGWRFYAGPFYYYLSGDFNAKETGTWENEGSGSWLYKGSGDIKADSNFGGFVGAQFDLAQNCNMTVEIASTGDGWGLGAAIAWKF